MKLARAAKITAVLLEEGLGYLTFTPGDVEAEGPAAPPDSEVPARLRRTLERLGPTFVKFGQMLATRVDLFGPAYTEEFAKLHASVEPFPTELAMQMLEAELGKPASEVFSTISSEPVAAASIAQVYRATLAGSGEDVAIKVQRPNLEDSLLADLDALLVFSGFIDRLVPMYHRAMVHRVAEEYALRAKGEMDFLAEARAIERFADVLVTLPEFRVPKLHHHLCTPRVLVMEWMDGTKLGDVADADGLKGLGFKPDDFCRSMLRLQISMAYEHGFVHGDTHPGNIILLPTGHIALIDFGLHGQVPRELREKMLEVIFCQAAGRTDEAVEAFVHVFQGDPSIDMTEFKAILKDVLSMSDQQGGIGNNRITEQIINGMREGSKYRMRSHSELFMVMRNLLIVEGIVIKYCPTLDSAEAMKEITGNIMRRKLFGPSMQEDLTMLVPQIVFTLSQRPRLASRLLKLEREFNEANSLGDFLRREGVIEGSKPESNRLEWVVMTAVVSLAAGVWIGTML